MPTHGRRLVWLLLALLAAAFAQATHRDVTADDGAAVELERLCHRLHLLPVGSLAHRRALAGCPQQPSLPKVVKDPPGSPGWSKDKFQSDFDAQRAKLADAKRQRGPTPDQDAALKALDAKHNDLKKLQDQYDADAAKRRREADAASKQAQQDAQDKTNQWSAIVDDRIKKAQHDADVNAAASAKAQDAVDVQRVEDAKAKLKAFEDAVMDAKAKAAGDGAIIKAFDDDIAKRKVQRSKDEEQHRADEKEARDDQALADSEAKRQRAADREARAKQREANANELQDTLNRARIAREDAMKRKDLLAREDVERARLQKQRKDFDDALAANRKKREADDLERQKRMDDYKKQEAEIAQRKKDYDDAEAQRIKRAKEREEARLKREKDEADEAARLKKAREEEGPPEQRPKRDDEEECKDKSHNCGTGRCLQKKDDPDSKRCQCQPGDKGNNCEHAGCEYDVTDRTGKRRKQRGNQVNGECVRWRGVYRCTCNKPWRLEVTCRQKNPEKGGSAEIDVPDAKCKGLRRPKNRYEQHVCEICSRGCRVRGRELEVNATAAISESTRELREDAVAAVTEADKKKFVMNCNNHRMMENTAAAFMFVSGSKKAKPTVLGGGGRQRHRLLPKRDRDDASMPPGVSVQASSFEKCQELCLDRHAATAPTDNVAGVMLNERYHCTWVWYSLQKKTCYLFASGKFPTYAVDPPVEEENVDMESDAKETSGFLAFVAYPRAFNLFRKKDSSSSENHLDIGEYRVVFGEGGDDETENDATFAYKRSDIPAQEKCTATLDTVREAALVFEQSLSGTTAPKALLPTDWVSRFGSASTASMTMTAKNGMSWTYEFDDHLRVKKVSALTSKVGSSDRNFDSRYRDITRSSFYNANRAPFDAGHLVAQEQGPPNLFFNYVPQHFNSNQGAKSCWWTSERQARYLIDDVKCSIEYVVRLDYNKNGERLPSEMKNLLPSWAQASAAPDHKKRGTRAPYLRDDYLCHYRYRPFTMSIDIVLKRPESDKSQCMPLFEAVDKKNMHRLFKIEGDNIVTSRVFAFYMVQPTATSLVRIFGLATAMHKDFETDKRMCYAETGNVADYKGIKFTYDFHKAFIVYEGKGGDREFVEVGKYDQWSMADAASPKGVLMHDTGCLEYSTATGSFGIGGGGSCLEFEYLYPADDLERDLAIPFQLGETGKGGGGTKKPKANGGGGAGGGGAGGWQ
ncbi:hypothetical protein PINS_up013544 [Pythium insidiosum]|nr:hypothetical protein PINS_up013544 [Pythium insidiosum]